MSLVLPQGYDSINLHSSQVDHLREVTSIPASVHQPLLNDNFGEPHWKRQSYTNLQLAEAPLDVDSQPRQSLPSPTFSNDYALVTEHTKESTPTTLPSFKELDRDLDSAFPSHLPSPPLDMLRITDSDRRQPYQASPSQDKYPTHESLFDPMYPYNHRYIQGEPNYQTPWQPAHPRPTQAPVTSISPHEIHRNPYPSTTGCVRPSQMGRHRSRSRGNPEYVKRPRRRAEEVERLYICNWEGCDKAYGALNHLNTHVRNADHGPKREPKEFAQIRREQKARVAREREAKSNSLYRHSGNGIYHMGTYPESTSTTSYPPHPPMNSQTYEALPLRSYESSSTLPHDPYDQHAREPRRRYEILDDHPFEDPNYPPRRWTPDPYNDLHPRYPTFSKDLMSQETRATTSSPRDLDSWPNDRHDSSTHASYGQGPNGSDKLRDPHQHYFGRKDF